MRSSAVYSSFLFLLIVGLLLFLGTRSLFKDWFWTWTSHRFEFIRNRGKFLNNRSSPLLGLRLVCVKGRHHFLGNYSEYSQKTLTDHITIVRFLEDFIIKFRFLSRSNMYRFLQTYELHTFEEHKALQTIYNIMQFSNKLDLC